MATCSHRSGWVHLKEEGKNSSNGVSANRYSWLGLISFILYCNDINALFYSVAAFKKITLGARS